MNVTKAIRIKALTGQEFLDADPDDIDEADRLSVEALKRLEDGRAKGYYYFGLRLLGETWD